MPLPIAMTNGYPLPVDGKRPGPGCCPGIGCPATDGSRTFGAGEPAGRVAAAVGRLPPVRATAGGPPSAPTGQSFGVVRWPGFRRWRGFRRPDGGYPRRVPRLRRTSPAQPGWRRLRSGRGFRYVGVDGEPIRDPEALQRIRDLVIPPAWREVWVSPHADGHLQAVGTDAKGRRQYLYHPQWRADRDREKHEWMVRFARRLPPARLVVAERLGLDGMPRERALALALRLLDIGLFRIGGELYAEENGSFGLATLRREHVSVDRDGVHFRYTAKSGLRREIRVEDEQVAAAVAALRRRRGGGEELLAFRDGGRWRDLTSADINGHVKEVVHPQASAKDFRTWHATVLAAVALARLPEQPSARARTRAVSTAVKQVSEYLGNTPSVCRASYIDPRVLDRFSDGRTVAAALRRLERRGAGGGPASEAPLGLDGVERAVLRLLADR